MQIIATKTGDDTMKRRHTLNERQYYDPPTTSSKREMINLLCGLGRDNPSTEQIQKLEEDPRFDYYFVFPVTFMQKLIAANEFSWEAREVAKLQQYHPFTDLVYLEPLMWEQMEREQLILYHPHDQSFWAFDPSIKLQRKDRLIKLGYSWAEVVLDWPCYHFYGLKMDAEERRNREAKTAQ
jgi:hypothetical protein